MKALSFTPPRLTRLHFALAGLQLADLLTTLVIITHGGYEANPITASIGLTPAKLLAIVITLRLRHRRLLAIAACYYGAVIAWNLSLIWRFIL